jgi:N-acetylmuramoyl-L-alanine amidase
MRANVAMLLLLLLAGGLGNTPRPATRTTRTQTDSVYISGIRYARLGDWARARGFDLQWLRSGESVQLTNRGMRIGLLKDSKCAQINGINVYLSHPVVMKNGAGFVADADLDNVVRPLLSPPKYSGAARVKTIVIDPGHGGKDPGYQSGSQIEKKYTLLLAQELRDQLNRAGFNASLTRTSDNFIELTERPDLARRRGADLFISLHWNSTSVGKSEVEGVETYCLTPAGAPSTNAGGDTSGGGGSRPGNRNDDRNVFLAYQMQRSITRDLSSADRGVRRARFMVLSSADMPAVLIEGGYLSHPDEAKRIRDAAWRKQLASAIVGGVVSYQKALAPAPTSAQTRP